MHVGLTNVIIVIACAILILLVMLLYLRSRQGDQRIITHSVLLAIVLVLAILIVEVLAGCM